jgi:ABC-type transport system substrate-binding protein
MYTTNDGVDPQSQIEGYFASSAIPTEANAGAGFNYSRWVNEEADELIALAGSSPDIEVRKDAYRQIMALISAELPHIYLYDRAEINLTRSHIQNFQVNPWSAQTWNVEDWALGN